MLKLIVAAAGLTALAACSGPAPARETAADKVPRRELELARVQEEAEIASPNARPRSAPSKPSSPAPAPKPRPRVPKAAAPAVEVVADSELSPETESKSVEATVASPVTDSSTTPPATPDTVGYAPYPT